MLRKTIIIIFAIALLTPWPVAFAYDNGELNPLSCTVSVAPDANQPFTVYGQMIGSVPTINLFTIDATNRQWDTSATLYITNTADLVKCYRYLIMECQVFLRLEDNSWKEVTSNCASSYQNSIISLRNGHIDFMLQGGGYYMVTIAQGSYYCTNSQADESTPYFFLEISD